MATSTSVRILAVLAIFGAAIGYGYYDLTTPPSSSAVLIDNPGSSSLEVIVDGKEYAIPAKSFVQADIQVGPHRIEARRAQQVVLPAQQVEVEGFEFWNDRVAAGVINPTASTYVIYNVVNTRNSSVGEKLKSQFHPYQVEGQEIYAYGAAPKVVNALFIPDPAVGRGNLNADTNEWFSKFDRTEYSVRPKIFRLADFFEFYDKNNR